MLASNTSHPPAPPPQRGSRVYLDREYTAAGFAFAGVEAATITLRVHRVPFTVRPPPLDESMLCRVSPESTAGLAPPPGAPFPAFPTLVVAESEQAAAAASRMAKGSHYVIGRCEHEVSEFVTQPSRKKLLGRAWEPTLVLRLPLRRAAAARGAAAGPAGMSLLLKDYYKPDDPGTLFCMTVEDAAAAAAASLLEGGGGAGHDADSDTATEPASEPDV